MQGISRSRAPGLTVAPAAPLPPLLRTYLFTYLSFLPSCVPSHFLSAYRERIGEGISHALAPGLTAALAAPLPLLLRTYLFTYSTPLLFFTPPYRPPCVPSHSLSAYRRQIVQGIPHALAPKLAIALAAPLPPLLRTYLVTSLPVYLLITSLLPLLHTPLPLHLLFLSAYRERIMDGISRVNPRREGVLTRGLGAALAAPLPPLLRTYSTSLPTSSSYLSPCFPSPSLSAYRERIFEGISHTLAPKLVTALAAPLPPLLPTYRSYLFTYSPPSLSPCVQPTASESWKESG